MDNCEICNKLFDLDNLEYYIDENGMVHSGKFVCKECLENE